MWSRGETTDHNMLAPDWSPVHLRLVGQSRFKPCLWPGYFLLQPKDCMKKLLVRDLHALSWSPRS